MHSGYIARIKNNIYERPIQGLTKNRTNWLHQMKVHYVIINILKGRVSTGYILPFRPNLHF